MSKFSYAKYTFMNEEDKFQKKIKKINLRRSSWCYDFIHINIRTTTIIGKFNELFLGVVESIR